MARYGWNRKVNQSDQHANDHYQFPTTSSAFREGCSRRCKPVRDINLSLGMWHAASFQRRTWDAFPAHAPGIAIIHAAAPNALMICRLHTPSHRDGSRTRESVPQAEYRPAFGLLRIVPRSPAAR